MGLMILVGASIPTSPLEKIQKSNKILDVFLSEISLHFFGFGLFALFLCAGFNKRKKLPLPYYRIFLYSFSYGLLIELFQIGLPYRFFSVSDLVVNSAGIAVGIFLFWRIFAC